MMSAQQNKNKQKKTSDKNLKPLNRLTLAHLLFTEQIKT